MSEAAQAAPMTALQRSYLQAFILAAIICWSPFKALAFVAPFLVAIWLLVFSLPSGLMLRNCLLLAAAWTCWTSAAGLLGNDLIVQNSLLAAITHGSFLVLLAVPGCHLASRPLLDRALRFTLASVAVEAAIGIAQGIYGYTQTGTLDISNGDFVEGTIHLAPAASGSFANAMFSANIAFSLLALIPFFLVSRRRGTGLFALGALALVMASVVHQLLFLIAATATSAACSCRCVPAAGRRAAATPPWGWSPPCS